MSKQVCFAGEPTLFREPIQGLPQQQSCPLTVVDFFRLPFCFPCNLRLRFCGRLIVQVREDHSAAAFQCAPTIVHIGGKMFQCAEEKERNRPFSRSARTYARVSIRSAKKPWIKSRASSAPHPCLRKKE